jgi:hypothetical protein
VQQRRLRDGDELVLGKTRLLFEEPADQPLLALSGEPDRPLPPEPPPPSEVETATLAAAAAAPSEPLATPPAATAPPKRGLDADLLIYALAAVVIAISVAGIVILMRTG